MKRKKKLESDAVNHGNKFCHPAHHDEHQQQAAAAAAATAVYQHNTQQQAGIYEYILVRRAAAYSVITMIEQVQVLCCETAHGVYVTEREKTVTTTHRAAAAAAAASAALCACIKLTSRLFLRHFNHHR